MGWFERHGERKDWHKKTFFDLPEKSQPESEFAENDARFRFLFDNMKSGVAIYKAINEGEDFIILDFNRAAEKIEKVKREDVTGKSVVEVFPGVKEMGLFNVFQRVWRTGVPEFHPSSIYKDANRIGWRENYVYQLPVGEIVAVYDDVTDRKRSELALRLSEQRFRAIADYTYYWESWISPNGTLLWVNPAVERISGYTVAECMKMVGYPLPLIYEDDRRRMSKVLEEACKGGRDEAVEFRICRKDVAVIWVSMAWQAIYDVKGVHQGYCSSIRDITESKLAQEELVESEKRYRSFVQNFKGIAFRSKLDSTPIFFHGAIKQITGYTENELLGGRPRWDQIIYSNDLQLIYYSDLKKLQTVPGFSCQREYRIIRKDGELCWVHEIIQNVCDKDGKIAFVQGAIYDITDRKQAEEEVEKVAKFPGENPHPIMRIGADGTILYKNRASEPVLAKWQCWRGDYVSGKWYQITMEVFTSGLQQEAELDCDGRVFNLAFSPIAGTNYVNVYGQDITWRKKAEDELRQNEQKFRTLYAISPMAIALNRVDNGQFLESNQSLLDMTGYTEEDFRELTYWDITPVDYKEMEAEQLKLLHTVGRYGPYEKEYIRKDGTRFPVLLSGVRMKGPDGTDLIYSVIQDITELKAKENAVRESEQRYRSFVQNFNGVAFRAKPDLTPIFIHGMIEEITGYTEEEFISGKIRLTQVIHPDDVQKIYDSETKKLQTVPGFASDREYRIVCKNGEVRWVHRRAQNQTESDGKVTYIQGTIYDITERKRAEEELREKEKKYRDLVETMAEGLGVSDKDYVFTYVNKRFADMLGYTQDEMVGHHVMDFMDQSNKDIMPEQIARRKRGISEPYDVTWIAKDGHKVYTMASPKGVFDAEGNFQGSFGVLTDITERKKLEDEREELHRDIEDKNKELEAVLYVTSHDLKAALRDIENFSNQIKAYGKTVQQALESRFKEMDEKARRALEIGIPETVNSIRKNTIRMDSILSGLVRISRVGSIKLNIQRLQMNDILGQVIKSMAEQIKKKNVKIEVEPLPDCMGDSSQIMDVFAGLLNNALKYLDKSRPGKILVSGKAKDNRSIYCVEDNGIGIEPQYHEKIFDMFHQLEHGKYPGEGLGLTIVRRILIRHRGKVWVESKLEKGSRFYVSLASP